MKIVLMFHCLFVNVLRDYNACSMSYLWISMNFILGLLIYNDVSCIMCYGSIIEPVAYNFITFIYKKYILWFNIL